MNYSTLCLLVAELEREQQATRKKRKAPSCRKCGKPMKGHKKASCNPLTQPS
jgi:hypothetical protein